MFQSLLLPAGTYGIRSTPTPEPAPSGVHCTVRGEIRGESTRGHTVIGILVYGNLLELSNYLPRKPTSFHAQGSQRMTTPGGSAPGLLGSAASVTVPPAAAAAASAAAAER